MSPRCSDQPEDLTQGYALPPRGFTGNQRGTSSPQRVDIPGKPNTPVKLTSLSVRQRLTLGGRGGLSFSHQHISTFRCCCRVGREASARRWFISVSLPVRQSGGFIHTRGHASFIPLFFLLKLTPVASRRRVNSYQRSFGINEASLLRHEITPAHTSVVFFALLPVPPAIHSCLTTVSFPRVFFCRPYTSKLLPCAPSRVRLRLLCGDASNNELSTLHGLRQWVVSFTKTTTNHVFF